MGGHPLDFHSQLAERRESDGRGSSTAVRNLAAGAWVGSPQSADPATLRRPSHPTPAARRAFKPPRAGASAMPCVSLALCQPADSHTDTQSVSVGGAFEARPQRCALCRLPRRCDDGGGRGLRRRRRPTVVSVLALRWPQSTPSTLRWRSTERGGPGAPRPRGAGNPGGLSSFGTHSQHCTAPGHSGLTHCTNTVIQGGGNPGSRTLSLHPGTTTPVLATRTADTSAVPIPTLASAGCYTLCLARLSTPRLGSAQLDSAERLRTRNEAPPDPYVPSGAAPSSAAGRPGSRGQA